MVAFGIWAVALVLMFIGTRFGDNGKNPTAGKWFFYAGAVVFLIGGLVAMGGGGHIDPYYRR